MNNLGLMSLVLLMTLLGALGSLGLKKGASSEGGLLRLVFSPWFVGGGLLYFVSALLDIWLLKCLPYVVVLPLSALTYGWSMALAWLVLKERISVQKIVGVLLIISGMVVLVI